MAFSVWNFAFPIYAENVLPALEGMDNRITRIIGATIITAIALYGFYSACCYLRKQSSEEEEEEEEKDRKKVHASDVENFEQVPTTEPRPTVFVDAVYQTEVEQEPKKSGKTNKDAESADANEGPTESARGLRNLGNTCYFNSTMQALVHTHFVFCEELQHLEKKDKFVLEVLDFFKAMKNAHSKNPYSPNNLHRLFGKKSPKFANYNQHDSHECLRNFLDNVRKEERDNSGAVDKRKVLTVVDSVFGGHFMTVYICKKCDTPYHVCEALLDISLPIMIDEKDLAAMKSANASNESRSSPLKSQTQKSQSKNRKLKKSAKDIKSHVVDNIGLIEPKPSKTEQDTRFEATLQQNTSDQDFELKSSSKATKKHSTYVDANVKAPQAKFVTETDSRETCETKGCETSEKAYKKAIISDQVKDIRNVSDSEKFDQSSTKVVRNLAETNDTGNDSTRSQGYSREPSSPVETEDSKESANSEWVRSDERYNPTEIQKRNYRHQDIQVKHGDHFDNSKLETKHQKALEIDDGNHPLNVQPEGQHVRTEEQQGGQYIGNTDSQPDERDEREHAMEEQRQENKQEEDNEEKVVENEAKLEHTKAVVLETENKANDKDNKDGKDDDDTLENKDGTGEDNEPMDVENEANIKLKYAKTEVVEKEVKADEEANERKSENKDGTGEENEATVVKNEAKIEHANTEVVETQVKADDEAGGKKLENKDGTGGESEPAVVKNEAKIEHAKTEVVEAEVKADEDANGKKLENKDRTSEENEATVIENEAKVEQTKAEVNKAEVKGDEEAGEKKLENKDETGDENEAKVVKNEANLEHTKADIVETEVKGNDKDEDNKLENKDETGKDNEATVVENEANVKVEHTKAEVVEAEVKGDEKADEKKLENKDETGEDNEEKVVENEAKLEHTKAEVVETEVKANDKDDDNKLENKDGTDEDNLVETETKNPKIIETEIKLEHTKKEFTETEVKGEEESAESKLENKNGTGEDSDATVLENEAKLEHKKAEVVETEVKDASSEDNETMDIENEANIKLEYANAEVTETEVEGDGEADGKKLENTDATSEDKEAKVVENLQKVNWKTKMEQAKTVMQQFLKTKPNWNIKKQKLLKQKSKMRRANMEHTNAEVVETEVKGDEVADGKKLENTDGTSEDKEAKVVEDQANLEHTNAEVVETEVKGDEEPGENKLENNDAMVEGNEVAVVENETKLEHTKREVAETEAKGDEEAGYNELEKKNAKYEGNKVKAVENEGKVEYSQCNVVEGEAKGDEKYVDNKLESRHDYDEDYDNNELDLQVEEDESEDEENGYETKDSYREAIDKLMTPLSSSSPCLPRNVTARKKHVTIYDCLMYFTRKEHIDNEYLCNDCYREHYEKGFKDMLLTSATKQTLIFNPPAILTLHLKRFELKPGGSVKRTDMITYGELLDIAPYCSSQCLRNNPPCQNIWYSLYGVVVHHGSTLKSGHYTAYVKLRGGDAVFKKHLQKKFFDRDLTREQLIELMQEKQPGETLRQQGETFTQSGTWHCMNDSWSHPVEVEEVLGQEAYLLFYERM